MQRTPQAQYERDFTALKHYLIGRGYHEALKALGIAVRWHVGFRKDKVTPQLHHQVWVCFNFLNTPIPGLTRKQEERALSAILLHDVVEDHPVTYADLIEQAISEETVELVRGMTKVNGESDDEFFERLLKHWLLAIMKACDRDNNVMTMQGAFAIPKMKSYIKETRDYILVLLKKASNLFPDYHRSYSALATGIKKQLRIYEGFIAATEAAEQLALEQRGVSEKRIASLEEKLAKQDAQLADIDRQTKELLSVNEQLQRVVKAKPATITATIDKAVQAALLVSKSRIVDTKSVRDIVNAIFAAPQLVSVLSSANEKADVISDLGPTSVEQNLIFRTD